MHRPRPIAAHALLHAGLAALAVSVGGACATARGSSSQDAAPAATAPAGEQPASRPDIRNPGPDLGSVPNSAQVVPPGRATVELDANTVRSHDHSVRTSFVPVLLRVGVIEDLELRALLDAVSHEQSPGGDATWGGPLDLGFKVRLDRGGAGFLHPSFGIEGGVQLPVASAGRDSGKLEPFLSLNVDHFVTPRGTLTWDLAALAPVNSEGRQYALGLLAAAYYQTLTDALQVFVSGDVSLPVESSGESSEAGLGTGLYWYATERVVFFAGVGFGVGGNSPDSRANLGLAYAF